MQVAFEIKGSKPKSSVNRLNLFKVLIVSSGSFLQGCVICSSYSSSSFSSSSSVIISAGCSENSDTIYSTYIGKIGWFQVESVLLETLNWMTTSLLGLFLLNTFSASYSVFKVTLLCFLFVVIMNTIHKQSSKQKNIKPAKRFKNIQIRKFEHDIFSIPFTVTSSETRRGNFFLNQNSNCMIENHPGDQIIGSI